MQQEEKTDRSTKGVPGDKRFFFSKFSARRKPIHSRSLGSSKQDLPKGKFTTSKITSLLTFQKRKKKS